MYTKSPDYIICDCGCPHYSSNTNSFYNNNNTNNNNCNSKFCYSAERKISPFMLKPNESIETTHVKLLPLRETLTEYYQRLLIERAGLLRDSGRADETAQLKQYKNQRNEAVKQRQQQQQRQRQQQQPRNSWRNQPHEGGNQNSTDKTFSRRSGNKQVTTLTTTKTTATTAATTTTHADSDCDDVF